MANVRHTSLGTALRYRGREGMWTWILHRATGLGILLFLIIHVIDTAIIIYWPGEYDVALGIYKHPVFRFAELLIFFSVLYHAVNGLRIVMIDFFPGAVRNQKNLWSAVLGLSVLGTVIGAVIIVKPFFTGS